MSYIIKNNNPILNVKITDVGRYKLASGVLNYTYFAVGDSEVNYNYPTPSGLNILKPKDNNPDIKYPLIPNESDPSNFFKSIDYQYVDKNIITNTAKIRGFFTGSSYNTISLYKQILNATSTDFTNTLSITVTTATTGNAYTPLINDMILISFSGETSVTVPVPYLWYRVTGVTGTMGTNFTMSLDRLLPKLNSYPSNQVKIFVYPSGDSITNYYGLNTPTAYWDSGNLNLSGTCTLSQYDVPVWNLSIVWNKNPMGYNTGYGPYKTDAYKGSLTLFNPSSTTYVKHFISTTNSLYSSTYLFNSFASGYGNTTSAVNAIQFKFNAGNIDAGKIYLYGIK